MFYVRNDDVQNGLGEAMPNIAVTYYIQPSLAPAVCYIDAVGSAEVPNPQYTNGLGQTATYLAAGLYTITYVGEQIQTLTYYDQLVGAGGGGGTGTTIAPYIPIPVPDGVTRIFTLPVAPIVPENVMLFLAGSFVPYNQTVTGFDTYTISGVTITWTGLTPPQTGDSIVCFY